MNIYTKDLRQGVSELVLSGDAYRHLRARRMGAEDALTLFDGNGLSAKAMVSDLGRGKIVCQVDKQSFHLHIGNQQVNLVLGVTKIPTMEFILQKATELGVNAIVLLQCEHMPIDFSAAVFKKKQDRFQKILISACEQSGQYIIPQVTLQSFDDYMSKTSDREKYLFHPHGGKRFNKKILQLPCDLMIGPEGGWSDGELERSKATQCQLTDTVLRADTACIAALLAVALFN